MGSKRRHDDDDEVSLKKRRKRNDSEGDHATTAETPAKEKRKSKGHELERNGELNGDVSFTHNEEQDECVVYLIRKPKNLSIEDLEQKLSLKKKVKSKTKTFGYESGTTYTALIAPSDTFMYHVPAGDLSPGNRIAGTVTVTENEVKNEEGDFMIHDDFLEDPPVGIQMPFVIAPVKRNPVLVLDGLKQRLYAYGCVSADAEETPRKVKKAKRKSKREDRDE